MRKIGYARVSTGEQNLRSQLDSLQREGCEQIYKDKATGGTTERLQLKKALKALEQGDCLVVTNLDRLSRSSLDFLRLMDSLRDRGVFFKAINQPFDTSTPAGRMMMQMVATFGEYERAMIRERTAEGLKAAKARGVKLGRPKKLTPHQQRTAKERLKAGETAPQIARDMNVSNQTIYRLQQSPTLALKP